MGNWMTVNIVGECAATEVAALRDALRCGDDYRNFHPLCFTPQPSICGLGDWAGEIINAVGNLAERDYDTEDVAKTCKHIVVDVPSLRIKIHCGGDNESKECVATITVDDGEVNIGPPEIETLAELSPAQIEANMKRAMRGI